MSQSNYITLALFAVICLVFLVDYLKKRKEDSLEKSVEKFVEKESGKKRFNIYHFFYERSNFITIWITNRKKNITLSILIISFLKVVVNHFFYPKWYGTKYAVKGFGYHLDCMFSERLDLFIPVTIVFLIFVWFFNDKIKAQ